MFLNIKSPTWHRLAARARRGRPGRGSRSQGRWAPIDACSGQVSIEAISATLNLNVSKIDAVVVVHLGTRPPHETADYSEGLIGRSSFPITVLSSR